MKMCLHIFEQVRLPRSEALIRRTDSLEAVCFTGNDPQFNVTIQFAVKQLVVLDIAIFT